MSDMASPYKTWPGLQSHALGEQALALRAAFEKSRIEPRCAPCRLSPLIAMSDPHRTPDIINWVKGLPDHCAVIYRFDVFDINIAKTLREMTEAKNQQFLIRGEQAVSLSDGQHFKRKIRLQDVIDFQNKHADQITTLAAIKTGHYDIPLPPIDALLVSSVFPSQSPSAGKPIGVEDLKKRVEDWPVPIYALGGITVDTAPELHGTGVAGIAAIGGLETQTIMTDNRMIITKEETEDRITFKAQKAQSSDEAVLNLSKVSTGVFNAHHTGVPKSMGGQGVGTALVKAMSEDARDNNYKIVPGCPFVAAWFKRKPKWAAMAEAK